MMETRRAIHASLSALILVCTRVRVRMWGIIIDRSKKVNRERQKPDEEYTAHVCFVAFGELWDTHSGCRTKPNDADRNS
jgi:hypothetical protein